MVACLFRRAVQIVGNGKTGVRNRCAERTCGRQHQIDKLWVEVVALQGSTCYQHGLWFEAQSNGFYLVYTASGIGAEINLAFLRRNFGQAGVQRGIGCLARRLFSRKAH